MAQSLSQQPLLFPINAAAVRKARQAAVLMLGLALVTVPPQVVFGQSNQQQEQQQREQQEREQQQRDQQQREQQEREQQQRDQQQRDRQEREQQQRDQQQRDQQEREQQQRDQQQREQQEREQQQRDQQQREQQEREQQQREQQQREQQAHEQQQRDQQQRDQQQREQQERMQQQQHSSSDFRAPNSNASLEDSRPTGQTPATDVKRTNSDIQPLGGERKVHSASAGNAAATKDHASSAVEPDLRGRVCEDGPCKEPAPKPVQLKPVAPEPPRKVCKDGPCKPCPKGQSEGKGGSCAPPPAVVKNGNVRGSGSARTAVQQPCPAGQVWDGAQCLVIGAQQCLPSQSRVGTTCQTDCAISTTSAQNIIMELRSARLHKDDICRQNPTGMECQEAEAHYNLEFTEYQNFLAGVPTECRMALPDPIAI